MFGWFRSSACTVDPVTRSWIDRRWRWLTNEFGADCMIDAPTILPTSEFFPDEYDRSDEAVQRLTNRVCGYMGVPPSTIDLKFYTNASGSLLVNETGDAIAMAGGTYQEGDERFLIRLDRSQFHRPMELVGNVA